MLSLSYLLQRLLHKDISHSLRMFECVTTETSSSGSVDGKPEVRLEDCDSETGCDTAGAGRQTVTVERQCH